MHHAHKHRTSFRPRSIQELLRPRFTPAHWEVAVRDVSLPGDSHVLRHVFVASGDRLLFSGEIGRGRPLTETLLSAVQTAALIRMEWPRCLLVEDRDAAHHIKTCLSGVIARTVHRPRLESLDRLVDQVQRHVASDDCDYPDEDRPETGASPQFVATMIREANPAPCHSGRASTSASNLSPRS